MKHGGTKTILLFSTLATKRFYWTRVLRATRGGQRVGMPKGLIWALLACARDLSAHSSPRDSRLSPVAVFLHTQIVGAAS